MCIKPMIYQVPLNPFTKFTKSVKVPCNYCMPCRIQHQSYLKKLCDFQLSLHRGVASFVTLTYTDESVPYSIDSGLQSLCKTDLQNFFKRFRKNYEEFKTFSYFACGEYGDANKRPHYHCILFGVPSSFSEEIHKCWNDYTDCVSRGLTDVKPLTPGGIGYITKYCLKQLRGKSVIDVYDNNYVTPPFMCHSFSLERAYILCNLDKLRQHDFFDNFYGMYAPLPAKIVKKYATHSEYMSYVAKVSRLNSKEAPEDLYRHLQSDSLFNYYSSISNGIASDPEILNFYKVNENYNFIV